MFNKFTKVTILLTVLALLLSMGAVFASAEEETTAPVLNVTRLDHTGSVFYTGGNFSPAFCYNIVNYDELTAYYGTAPVWSVAYSDGGENYFSTDDQGAWLRVDFRSSNQEPAEVTIDVQCTAGDQVFTDAHDVVIREHPVGALESLNFPTVIDGVAGVEQQLDVSGIMPEGWLEDGVDYVLSCGSYSSGMEINHTDAALTVSAAESGLYLMYLQVECSTYLLQHNFVYRVADAEGNVPELPLSLACSSSASEPITLYAGGTEYGMSLASIVPENSSMQELLREGTPEWTVTCTGGDESLIRSDVLTYGVEFYLQTAAEQPQTVSFDVTCSWGGETAQRTLTINVVEPGFDMPSCLLPDEMTFDLGEERTIPLADMFSTDGLDETLWPVNRWMNANFSALDYVINEDQMVLRAHTPGIYQADFCMSYANIHAEKRVLVYIRDAEGNLPTIPQPAVSVVQHYDTLYTNGNEYPELASVSLTNADELLYGYGYNDYSVYITDVQGGDYVFGFNDRSMMLIGQPTTAGTTAVTIEMFLDHSNDAMDQTVTQTLTFQILEPAQELLNATYEAIPVSAQLGEELVITPGMLAATDSGVDPQHVTITGWRASSAGELTNLDENLTLSVANSGAHRLWINWRSSNLSVGSWLPVLVAYEDGTPAQIPTLSLSATATCDVVFIQRNYYTDLVSFKIDDSDELYQYYQNDPEWTVTIENDVDGFIYYTQSSWGVNTGMNCMPVTPGDVTITVTCTLGNQTQTLGHIINVSDQGREDFCGISFPTYIQVQQGEVFSMDAIELLADDSWRLPTGTPTIVLTNNDAITSAGVDGTICSWTASTSGVHRVGMYWRWGNYTEYNMLDIIVADENGVYPTVEPTLNFYQHFDHLYLNGNRLYTVAYIDLSNYATLNELYGIDTMSWDVTMLDDCGAELAITSYGSNYANVGVTQQPTATGTLTAELQVSFDYADDSLNTSYTFPMSFDIVDPGMTFPSEPVQLDDVVTTAGEVVSLDTKDLLSEEALAALTNVNYEWPNTMLGVNSFDGSTGLMELVSYESGVYRVVLRLNDANIEVKGYADVYVTDESGVMPSKPVFELTEDIYNTTVYCNTGSMTDLLALTVRDSAALERYYGADLGWSIDCIGDDEGIISWTDENNGVEKTLRFIMWNVPCTSNEITVYATAVIGAETLERTYVIRCVDLGNYSSGTPYASGPWEMAVGQPLTLSLNDLLPPEVDASSATFSFSQTSGTEYAQVVETSLGNVVLEAVQSGVARITFDWSAANASGTCSAILAIADEEGNLPDIPTVSIREELFSSALYIGGNSSTTLARYTLENAEALVELYGTNPVWNVDFSDDSGILFCCYDGAWNETLCLVMNNTPTAPGEITVNISCSYGMDMQAVSRTISLVDTGMPMYGSCATQARQAQVGDTVTLSLSDILPAAVNPDNHAEISFSQENNHEYLSFEQNGSDAVFTIHQSGVISTNLRCCVANMVFYVRVPFLVADETGVYPELPEITMERNALQDTIYVGGTNQTDVVTYSLPDHDNLGNAYGNASWEVRFDNDVNGCMSYYTAGSYNQKIVMFVVGTPQEAGVITANVTCRLGDFSYNDSFELTVVENPGIESGQHIDYGEVQAVVGQSVTLPIADLLPQGVDPTSADFILTQTSSTEFAEFTSWNNSEAVFAMRSSAVIGMQLRWTISNITGTASITFVVADEEGNVPTVPEFSITEEAYSSVIYIGGIIGGTPLATYTFNNARAYYAYTGNYPSLNYSITGQDGCIINVSYGGEYMEEFSINTCCAPWEPGEVTVEVSCDYAGQSDSFTHTITIVEGPFCGDYESISYGPIDLPLNESAAIDPALILPQGIDLTNAQLYLELTFSDVISLEDTSNSAVTLRADQSGYCRADFRWTSSNRAGYSNVVFRVANEDGTYPDVPTFSVEKNVVNDTIYTAANDYVTLAEYTVPDAVGLALLENQYISWDVSFDQDPESVMWYEYIGSYNETLRISMMNMPYSTGTLSATVSCSAGEASYTDTLSVTVDQRPDNDPDFFGLSDPIITQVGQTFSIDAMSLIQTWTLPTGAPTLVLDGNSDRFQLVATEGSVYTWKALQPMGEHVSLHWRWSNFSIYTSVTIIANDENGNPPAIEPQYDGNTYVEQIFTGGNLNRDIGSVWVGNYEVLDTLYDLEPIEWSYTVETDTGLTVRSTSGDSSVSLSIVDQPVSAGEALIHITGYAAAADPANSFSFDQTLRFPVEDRGAIETSSMNVVTAGIDEEVTVNRADVIPAGLADYTDRISFWYDCGVGMWMSEDSDQYDKFIISETGLCSAIYRWEYANFSGRYALVVQSPDENGEVPAVPGFELTRTELNTCLSINGNIGWNELFIYELADAEALTRINGGNNPQYDFNYYTDIDDVNFSYSHGGDWAENFQLILSTIPSSTGTINIRVTCSAGAYSQTFNEVVTIVEGPAAPPADLAAEDVIQVQAGQTFSIDAAAFTEDWSMPAGTPSLTLGSDAGSFEYVGCEGTVYTWRALNRGLFSIPFQWQWSNYSAEYTRIISVAGEDGVYPSTEPEFSTFCTTDTLYLEGNLNGRIADVYMTNYGELAGLKQYHSISWYLESIEGAALSIYLNYNESHAYIDLSNAPTETGTVQINLVCSLDSWDDANDSLHTIPLTFTVVERPEGIIENTYVMEPAYVELNGTFVLDLLSAVPEELRGCGNASGWLSSIDGTLTVLSHEENIITIQAAQSGIWIINCGWSAGNLSGNSRLLAVVADENGVYPEIPVLEIQTEVLTDTVYTAGNTSWFDLAAFTVEDVQLLSEINGGYGFDWTVSIEGDTDGVIDYYHNFVNDTDSVLRLRIAGYPSTLCDITVTVTAFTGPKQVSSTVTIHIVQGPDNLPVNLVGDEIIRTQVGQTFSIDAADVYDGWSLPTGTPTLRMTSDTEHFELVSVDGSVYTWRALTSGAFSPSLDWQWSTFRMWPSRSIIVADENGVEPSLSPEFSTIINSPTLYVGGSHSVCLAEAFLDNYTLLNALYGVDAVTWSVSSSELDIHADSSNTFAAAYLSSAPAAAGEATVEFTCSIDYADDSMNTTYGIPVTITIEDAPFAIPESYRVVGDYVVGMGESFTISFVSTNPDELADYTGEVMHWVSRRSSDLSDIYETEDSCVITAYNSGVYFVDITWRCVNISGVSRFYLLVADEEGNVPQRPVPDVTENVQTNVLYAGGNSNQTIIATYTVENAEALTALYGSMPWWNFSATSDLLGYRISGSYNEVLTVCMNDFASNAEDIQYTVTCSSDRETRSFENSLTVAEIAVGDWPTCFADGKNIIAQTGETFTIDASSLENGWSLPAGTPTLKLWCENAEFELVESSGSLYTFRAPASGIYAVDCTVDWLNYQFFFTTNILVADENGTVPSLDPEFDEWSQSILFNGGNLCCHLVKLHLTNTDILNSLHDLQSVTYSVANISQEGVTINITPTDYWTYFTLDGQPSTTSTLTFDVLCTLDAADDANDQVVTRSYAIPIEENPGLDLSIPFTDAAVSANAGEPILLERIHAVPNDLYQYAEHFEIYLDSCSEHLSYITSEDGAWSFQAEKSGIGTVRFEWNLGNLLGFSNVHVLIPDENGVYPEVPAISDTETVYVETLHTGMDFSGDIVTFTLNDAAALADYYSTPIIWEPLIYGDDENVIYYVSSGENNENFTFYLTRMPSEACNITLNVMCYIGHTNLSLHQALNIYTGPGTLPTGLAVDTPIITQVGQTFSLDAAALNDGWTLSFGTPTLSLLSEENFRLVSNEGSVYTYEALSTGGFTENLDWQWTNYHTELPVSIIVTDETGSITPVDPVIDVLPRFTLDDESILLYAGDGNSMAIADLVVINADDLYLNSVTWAVDSYSDPAMALHLSCPGNGATGSLMLDCAPANVGSDVITLRCIIDSLVDSFDSEHTIEVPVTVLDNPLNVADDYYLGDITLPYGSSFEINLADVIPADLGEEACALGTADLNGYSTKLNLDGNDGQILSWTAREPGVYRVEFFWRVSNTYGVSHFDVYAADEDGTTLALPTIDGDIVTHDEGTIYTGGNLSAPVVEVVIPDYYRLYDYWGEYPEINVACNWGTNDAIAYTKGGEPYAVAFVGNNVPVAEVLDQLVTISLRGETREYACTITVAEAPEGAPEGIKHDTIVVDAPAATFSLDAEELFGGWTLPTGTPTLTMTRGSDKCELASVSDTLCTWTAPDAAGVYELWFDLKWANYYYQVTTWLIVPDENGEVAQPDVGFMNDVLCNPLYIGGNYHTMPIATFHVAWDQIDSLKETYGYDQIRWEIDGYSNLGANFRLYTENDGAQIFLVDQPTEVGEITIDMNCILDSANDALDFVIPTSVTVQTAEWTGGDYTTPVEYGVAEITVGETFNLDVLSLAPQGVAYIEEVWHPLPSNQGIEVVNFDNNVLSLAGKLPGIYPLPISWGMENITGTINVELHVLDENGNLPPQWDVTETLALDNTLYIGGRYGVDLINLTLENAQAVAEYAGEIVWNVTYEGDPDYILRGYTSGDYNESFLVTTEYVCKTPSDITVHVTCTAGSMGTIFDRSYPVHVVQGPETEPVITLDDPLTTQLGQTFTIDAAAIAGDWTLPTGQPWLTCNSDKIELVAFDGTSFTFRALESGVFQAGFTWRWSTYRAYDYIDFIVYNEDGTLPLIEPDLYQHAWVDVHYAGGNSLRNTVSIFVENFDALQQLYGYGEPTWTITSSTGYEEYFTTSTYSGSSCAITLAKAPEAAASFELEVTGMFDAADDQYDQTVTVNVPITFGVVENLPEIPETMELDLGVTYYGGQFGFSAKDILPAGFSLPTGEINIQTYDSFDMHDQQYTADGSFLYKAQESGSFRMYVSWVWENFQGWVEVLLYVEPNNTNTNFDFNETDNVIHTVFINGDVPDSHSVRLNEDMMEFYQATPVWSLKHVYGTAYDYSLNVDADSFGAKVTAASIPSYEGYGIYELSCTWGSETYTQPLYITSTTAYAKPTHLDLPDEVTLAYTDEPYVFNAYSAFIEGCDGLYESEAAQRLRVVSASCELWVGYDYELTHIKPLSTGVQTVRLRWECGNLVLYKDVVFKMLDENGELPPQWSIEETIHDDTIYIGGGYGFDLLELELVNGPALSEYAGTIYWDVTYEGNSDNVLIKGVGGECGERMVISTDVLPASPVDDITVHISCQVGSMGEIFSKSYVIHVVEGTYTMPTVNAPASVTTQLGSTFTIDAASLVGDWSLSTGSPRILFISDKIEHVSSEGSLHTFRALESGILDGGFVWRWNTYLSSGSFDLIVCDEDGNLPLTAPTVERVDQCDIAYVGGNKPVVFSSFSLTNLSELTALYGYEDVIWTITSTEGYESYFALEDLGAVVHLTLDKQPDFEGSFELVLTGLLDAMNDQFNQTVSFTIPVTFAPRVDAPARSKTLPAIVVYQGETFTVSRSDILPANWSLPTGQSQCYQADYVTAIKLLSDTEEGMTFQPQEAGMFELPIGWEWGNFGGTTYVPVYVRPVYSADFGVGTETAFERTLFLEGNVIDTQSFHVVTNDTVIEGTPVWGLTHMYGQDMGYTTQTSADGHEFVISASELPSRTGTVIMELTCAWGDTSHVIPLVFHVISAPDGMPTDVNLPDTISTKVGEVVTLSPAALPEGWSVEGVAQKLTTIVADETLFCNNNHSDGTISVIPNEAGTRKITVQWSCANIVLTKEVTLRVAREDGMFPPETMNISHNRENDSIYFINPYNSVAMNFLMLENYDEIQSYYGGTPQWEVTVLEGDVETTIDADTNNRWIMVLPAVLPTHAQHLVYQVTCTWGDMSVTNEYSLNIVETELPTELAFEPLYRMEIGDSLTITEEMLLGDVAFDSHGTESVISFISYEESFLACFDQTNNADGSITLTAKASTFGYILMHWRCSNASAMGQLNIVVADENGVYPETDMIVEPGKPAEQTFYVGGTSTEINSFRVTNYNDLFSVYGTTAEWTVAQLSGTTPIVVNNATRPSGCYLTLASAPTAPETITFQVNCDWNGATSYQSEVFTIHVIEPECALPTSLPAEAVYFAEVGETVTLSASGLTPEGWTHTENDPYIILAGVNSNFTDATTTERLANGDVTITAVTPGLHKFQISWYNGNVKASTVSYFAIPDEDGVVDGLTFKGFNNYDENSTYYIGGSSVELCGFYMTNADELKRIYGSDFRPEWSYEVTSGGDLVELYTGMTDDETGFFVLLKEPLSKTGTLTYTVTCSADGHVLKTWNMTANIVESPTGLPTEIITPEKIIVNLGDTLTFGPATVVAEDWTAPEGAMVLGGVNDDSVLADAFEFAYESDGTGHYTALTPGIYDVNLYWRMNNHMLYKDVTIYVCYEDGTVPVPVIELYNEFGDTRNLYIGGNHNLANVFYIADYSALFQKYGGTPEWTVTQTSGESVGAYFVPYEYSEDMYQMFLSKTSSKTETVELQVEVRWGDAVGTFTQTITFSEPDFNMPTGFITPELVELKVGETLSLPECPVNTEGLDYDDWGFGRVTDDWFQQNFTYMDYVDGCELYRAEASGVTSITFEWVYRNYRLSQDTIVVVLEEDGTRPIPELKTTREDVQTDFSVGDEPTLITSVTLSDEVFEAYSQHVSTKPTWSAFCIGDHKVQLQHREDGLGMDVYLTEAPATIGTTEVSVFMNWLGVTTQDTITIRVTETMPEVAIRAERFLLLQGMSCQVDLTGDLTGWTTAWSTSDGDIATVDENGVVTAVGSGLTFIKLDLTTPAGSSKHLVVAVEVLTDVFTMTLPAALTEIEDEAFWGTAAGYIVLPYGVTTIGESAFAYAPNLKLVLIPATVTSIPDSILDGTSAAILCDPGSAAEAFAIRNGIPYYFVK